MPNPTTGTNVADELSDLTKVLIVVLCVIILVVMLAAGYRIRLFLGRARHDIKEETNHMLEQNKSKCKNCGQPTLFAYCKDCKEFRCEKCTDFHQIQESEHTSFQVQILEAARYCCDKCQSVDAKFICITGKELLCSFCQCNHSQDSGNKKMLMLVQNKNQSYQRNISIKNTRIYTLQIPEDDLNKPRQIRGLACLSDNLVVVIDSHNESLLIFQDKDFISNTQLTEEPRGITNTKDDRIAVTFAASKKIIIYCLKSEVTKVSEVCVKRYGKPSAITYDKGYFAVEVGEGKLGKIVILDDNGDQYSSIPAKQETFGFFTGNSIRLALDMYLKKLYVSALGKNSVSCMDLTGRILWTTTIQSPRGIVIQNDVQNGENLVRPILVASKKNHTIYILDSDNGHKEPVLDIETGLRSPRYLAYSPKLKHLFTDNESGNIDVHFLE